jgi:hypothetical protein
MHLCHDINTTILDGIWPPHFFNMAINFFVNMVADFPDRLAMILSVMFFLFGSTDEICRDGNEIRRVWVPIRFCTWWAQVRGHFSTCGSSQIWPRYFWVWVQVLNHTCGWPIERSKSVQYKTFCLQMGIKPMGLGQSVRVLTIQIPLGVTHYDWITLIGAVQIDGAGGTSRPATVGYQGRAIESRPVRRSISKRVTALIVSLN